ncbi:MAG: hypothetical protein OEZ58_08020 [Gammaproteobacteria bacterium]|nr:hypothetical protein [Gammaproteobacteria bacterium]MDH5728923.1 hypothetical protein [Gammaproteobacteria bacterium]
MFRLKRIIGFMILALMTISALAQVPTIVPYSGSLSEQGSKITGDRYFGFAIVNSAGEDAQVLWSNGLVNSNGELQQNNSSQYYLVRSFVDGGRFDINLGDISLANMQAIPTTVFQDNSQTFLRVWVSSNTQAEPTRLSPDRRLSSVPYSLQAGVADRASQADNAEQSNLANRAQRADVALSLDQNFIVPQSQLDTSGLQQQLNNIECGANEFITSIDFQSNSSTCSLGGSGNGGTSYSAGNGISISGTTISIASAGVDSAQIADAAVTSTKIASNAIDSTKIANNAVVAGKIAANAVGENQLVSNSIVATKIATGAVINSKIAAGAVDSDNIANAAVTTVKLSNNAVNTNQLADNAVTAVKIANNAVGSNQIASAAVTGAKLATNAVDTNQISNGAVSEAKLAANSVSETKIMNDAITSAKIANGTVTADDVAFNINKFSSINAGGNDFFAANANDNFKLSAGANVTLQPGTGNEIIINASGGGGGGSQNVFTTIDDTDAEVDPIVASSTSDTLTVEGVSNATVIIDAGNKKLSIGVSSTNVPPSANDQLVRSSDLGGEFGLDTTVSKAKNAERIDGSELGRERFQITGTAYRESGSFGVRIQSSLEFIQYFPIRLAAGEKLVLRHTRFLFMPASAGTDLSALGLRVGFSPETGFFNPFPDNVIPFAKVKNVNIAAIALLDPGDQTDVGNDFNHSSNNVVAVACTQEALMNIPIQISNSGGDVTIHPGSSWWLDLEIQPTQPADCA